MKIVAARVEKPVIKGQSFTVARLLLESYFRHHWLWGELVIDFVLYALMFMPIKVTHALFFAEAGTGLAVLSILGAVVLVRHSIGGRTYLVLARLTTRRTYAYGLIIATAVLRLPFYLIMLGMVLLGRNLENPDFGSILAGSVGLLANCLVVSALSVVLSPPITTRLERIIFLVWLVGAFTPLQPSSWLLDIVRLPLLPFAACFGMGQTGTIEWYGWVGLGVNIVYFFGLVKLAGYWFEKRELILH